jgi:3-oxoacyl-[acyl-carrier protein] reductase
MKAAIVTGAGRGIGRVVAQRLAGAGARVHLVARSRHELEETAAAIRGAGGDAVVVTADVTDSRPVAKAAEAAEPVDLLVNNAGTLDAIGPPWEVGEEEWWRDVETTLRGAHLWARAVLPGMIERRHGTIVNISSGSALRPEPYTSGYRAGKAALATFSEDLAAATRAAGIAVFAVAPGFVETGLTERLVASPEGRRWKPEAQTAIRIDPELIAGLVLRLASGDADALSGRFLHALDDLDELLARVDEVERDDLYTLRLRRLSR